MINNSMFTSKTDDWATPQYFFDELNKEFNFTLDPCADKKNAKCKKFFTKKEDGLMQSWDNEIVFCNPPYGRGIKDWVNIPVPWLVDAEGRRRCSSAGCWFPV